MENTSIALIVLIVLVVLWVIIGRDMSRKISPSTRKSWKTHWSVLPFKGLGGFLYPYVFLFIFNIGLLINGLTENDSRLLDGLFVLLIIVGIAMAALVQDEIKEK